MFVKTTKIFILMMALAIVSGGCTLWPGNIPEDMNEWGKSGKISIPKDIKESLDAQTGIKRFSDYDELAEFLEDREVNSYSYLSLNTRAGGMVVEDMVMEADFGLGEVSLSAPMAKKEAVGFDEGSVGSEDFSKTNVQVEGVDEADIIKTDGKYVYAVVQNNLYIVDAYPAEKSEVIAKIEFKSRPQDIYINDDKLVVFGQDADIYNSENYRNFKRRYNYTFFKVFDVSDHKNPKEVRDLDFEGNYSNSRMIGDYVYFVTDYHNYYYVAGEPIVPRVLENGEALAAKCENNTSCFAPEVYYFDIPYDSYNFTSVTAINVKDPGEKINGDVYILSGNQNMFVSQQNLYITYTKYVSEYQLAMAVMREMIYPKLSEKNQERIREIEEISKYILNDEEKMVKVSRIIERYMITLSDEDRENFEKELEQKMKDKYKDLAQEMEKTVIHKIAINKGKLEYKTHGEVTGNVLNQFSMDENGDNFRIATTKNRTWSQYVDDQEALESYSNLYVLDKDLKVIGSVEKLAPGERIYSVRFMQDRAYLVTFKQTDPLFAIDLRDPRNPAVLGELKIPGFSTYLHPYNNNFLIGIGKDTKETEWGGVRTLGLKLSLFDVSDVANPKEVDTYAMGDAGSDSIALNDHRAFLFSRDKNLLVLPATINEDIEGRGWGSLTFSGAVVFSVTEEGFELKGKIDHSDGGKMVNRDCWWGYCYYDSNVLRSLYMDDTLYTFSNKYLKMNKLDDLKTIKNLELKKEKAQADDDFVIIN